VLPTLVKIIRPDWQTNVWPLREKIPLLWDKLNFFSRFYQKDRILKNFRGKNFSFLISKMGPIFGPFWENPLVPYAAADLSPCCTAEHSASWQH
jgi:hypothetical protein